MKASEVEAPEWPYKKTSIYTRLRKGQDQADALILFFAKEVNVRSVERAIQDQFKVHRNFKKAEIWINFKRIGTYFK